MQKKCLCSFNRRPKMQKNAFVHLVEDPKSKKTTFFIITNLPPQPFSSKYQTIFHRLSVFPANIKRYLSPARRTKAYPWGLDRGRRAPRDPREENHLVKKHSTLKKNSLLRKDILVLKKSSPCERKCSIWKNVLLAKEVLSLKKFNWNRLVKICYNSPFFPLE